MAEIKTSVVDSETIEKMVALKVMKVLDEFTHVKRNTIVFNDMVRQRDEAKTRLSMIETRLKVLTKLVVNAKNIDKLEKETMVGFIDSWKEEDEHLEAVRVAEEYDRIKNIGMNYPR